MIRSATRDTSVSGTRKISTQKLHMYDNRVTTVVHTHIYHIYESAHIDNLNRHTHKEHITSGLDLADNSLVYTTLY